MKISVETILTLSMAVLAILLSLGALIFGPSHKTPEQLEQEWVQKTRIVECLKVCEGLQSGDFACRQVCTE